MSNRAELLACVAAESQRHYAAYTLFNQALADRIGLHPTDVQCIALLDLEPGPVTTGQIARLTGLASGSASRLGDRLERAGFVERRPDPNDRRRALVTLTPDAATRIAKIWETPGKAFGTMLDRYTDEQLQTIVAYLRDAAEVGRDQARRLTTETA
ncbi:MarR family winged helix-turn-helix transcriptional regulator [Streptomyces sp. NPDC058960]|uniref:MarR family winged helix-turn-helix transcriptional regulator n=1 Tax=Streptomyces sp. NPDC058960 TaxID=3346679 RepID=UPI00369752E7